MQEKPSWRPIKNKLLYLNLFIYSLILLVAVLFSNELFWAQKALRGYLWSNNFAPPADMLISKEAIIHLAPDGDLDYARQLLEKAVQIDPYSRARYHLGDCFALQQKPDEALACYERYRQIDPSYWRVYLKSIRLLANKKDADGLETLLSEAIAFYTKRVSQYQPQLDTSVEQPYNQKAEDTYQISVEVLKQMQAELERIKTIKQKQNPTNH